MPSLMSGKGTSKPEGAGPVPEGPTTRDGLAKASREEEARLRRLEAERAEAKARLVLLRADLAGLEARRETPVGRSPAEPSGEEPRTPADKVKLFRQLFRGRPDLYATRFVGKKTGKPGYAPACSKKFVPGVCELPRVKWGDCTKSRLFFPSTMLPCSHISRVGMSWASTPC